MNFGNFTAVVLNCHVLPLFLQLLLLTFLLCFLNLFLSSFLVLHRGIQHLFGVLATHLLWLRLLLLLVFLILFLFLLLLFLLFFLLLLFWSISIQNSFPERGLSPRHHRMGDTATFPGAQHPAVRTRRMVPKGAGPGGRKALPCKNRAVRVHAAWPHGLRL